MLEMLLESGQVGPSNVLPLMRSIGVTSEEIDIRPSCEQMLRDLGHPWADGQPVYDVSFENVQAGERTSHLFRLANMKGALVLGTGDVGRQVVQALVSRGASQVSVASRTFENARVLAEEFAGSSLTLADALRQAHAHDVIVGCATVERALLDAVAADILLREKAHQRGGHAAGHRAHHELAHPPQPP